MDASGTELNRINCLSGKSWTQQRQKIAADLQEQRKTDQPFSGKQIMGQAF